MNQCTCTRTRANKTAFDLSTLKRRTSLSAMVDIRPEWQNLIKTAICRRSQVLFSTRNDTLISYIYRDTVM